MAYLLGIDIGTSGTKAALFCENGKAAASFTVEYPLYQPQNGYAEQDPEDWYSAVTAAVAAVMGQSGVKKEEVKGIGLSGQMHGLVMLGKNGEVLRRAILWCDQRTGAQCEQITERVGGERLIAITANPALTGFTASKILWVRENEPEIYEKCRHILLPKDYIRYRLTGELATDVSDASGMQLLDVPNRRWSAEILDKLQIDSGMLARVYESPEVTGRLLPQAAEKMGLPAGIIVVGGAGDNAAAAVGVGVVRDKTAFTTIGTSGVVFAHTSQPLIDPAGRVHTFCCAVPGAWHVMGVTQGAGLSLRWFRDQFCGQEAEQAAARGVDVYKLLDALAEASPIGANRLLYLPYLMGERTPHLDPNVRGVFFGLSAMHTKADCIRAVMEGVSYSLRDCLSVFQEMDVPTGEMLACGGGANSPLWRRMLADVYGCTVKTTASREGPALGAALLAGVGAGVYKTVSQACEAAVHTGKTIPSTPENHARYSAYYQQYRALYPALKENWAALAAL